VAGGPRCTHFILTWSVKAGLFREHAFSMSSNSNLAFGSRLRAHRERHGLTLAALAHSLKTKQSLLEELERDDVSRWPPGIYGRGLVREYAKLVGLGPDEIVQQFIEFVAAAEEQPDMAGSGREREDAPAAELRLTFADGSARFPKTLSGRLVSAAVELIVVVATGSVVAFIGGLPGWTANAIIALTWYPARAAFWGHDAFYRILRLQRLSNSSLWSHTTEIPPGPSLMWIGKTVPPENVDSIVDDPFNVETDVNTAASLH